MKFNVLRRTDKGKVRAAALYVPEETSLVQNAIRKEVRERWSQAVSQICVVVGNNVPRLNRRLNGVSKSSYVALFWIVSRWSKSWSLGSSTCTRVCVCVCFSRAPWVLHWAYAAVCLAVCPSVSAGWRAARVLACSLMTR